MLQGTSSILNKTQHCHYHNSESWRPKGPSLPPRKLPTAEPVSGTGSSMAPHPLLSILCDLCEAGQMGRANMVGCLRPLESLAGCQGLARGCEHGQRQAWGKFQVHSHVPALCMSPFHPAIPLGDELTFSLEPGCF